MDTLIASLPEAAFAFFIASLLLELTPGPNMTWLALLAASHGRRAGFEAVLGICLGLGLIGLAAAIGMAEIIARQPVIYEALRWAGIAFLLYLAWDGWRGEAGQEEEAVSLIGAKHFRRGLLANLLNPKAFVFYIAVLPTFADKGEDPLASTLWLTLIYVAVATAVHSGIVVLAGALQPVLMDPKREEIVRRVLSVLLAGVAVWFGWSTAR